MSTNDLVTVTGGNETLITVSMPSGVERKMIPRGVLTAERKLITVSMPSGVEHAMMDACRRFHARLITVSMPSGVEHFPKSKYEDSWNQL